MDKYQPKLHTIEAVKFEGEANAKDILDWIKEGDEGAIWSPPTPAWVSEDLQQVLDGAPERLHIDPLGDARYADLGDYIIKDSKGRFGVELAEVFEARFERSE